LLAAKSWRRSNQQKPHNVEDEAPTFPPAPVYPSDVDWKSLPSRLMAEAIAMPNDVESKRHNLSFLYDATGDIDDLVLASTERIAETALDALDLGEQLRERIDATIDLRSERTYLEMMRDGAKRRFAARAGRVT
jgi:hypothetical protein